MSWEVLVASTHQVKELGIEKDEAEKALAAEKGDLVKTIVALTAPPS
jgi:NACalpha-BTF3-like transcription factor